MGQAEKLVSDAVKAHKVAENFTQRNANAKELCKRLVEPQTRFVKLSELHTKEMQKWGEQRDNWLEYASQRAWRTQ